MIDLVFRGHVEKGEGIARRLGCPTANIELQEGGIIPGLGVYVGETEVEGQLFPSVICINDGREGKLLKMEVHLLDTERELIGEFLQVRILEKTRDLVEWDNDQQIRDLIANDLDVARKWFSTHQNALGSI